MRKLLCMFTIALLSTSLVKVEDSTAGVLCNPAYETDCKPVVEHLWLKTNGKAEKAMPVVIAYVHNPGQKIHLGSYPDKSHLENDLDTQVINIMAEFTSDNEFLSFLRETGEVFNGIRIVKKVDIKKEVVGDVEALSIDVELDK